MKKFMMTLAARRLVLTIVFCCAMIPVGNIQAQDKGKINITVTQREKKTINLFLDDNTINPEPYQGEELRSGVINVSIGIDASSETGDDVVTPANQLFHVSFTDPYGRIPFLKESNDVVLEIFKELKYLDYVSVMNIGWPIWRGGQYVYRNYIPGIDYTYEETVEVKDEPSARVRYNSVKVGNDIEVKAFYNTGYPYDVNQFNGSENATLRLFALGKDDNGDTKETEVLMTEKPLRLFRPDQPLVAAIDSIKLTYCDPEPGRYRLKMESNWTQEGANRNNILITVNDTVRCFAALDKSKYVAGTDTDMKLHVKLNYGYPYVMAETSEDNPTVIINTYVMTSDDNWAETIQTSTFKIMGAYLADQPLDWEGDIKTAEYIEENEKTPLSDTSLYIKVEVVFNGQPQYTKIIPFDYIAETSPTGVRAITDNQPADDHWYDIQGIRMDSKPTQNGVYIQNHKKVIIK